MVGVLTAWRLAHFVGVGFAADLVLLVVAGLLLGPINVGGMIYNAYHASARPHDR